MPEKDIVTPIMPTGSGVVDLEIARERDALAAGKIAPPEQSPLDDTAAGHQAENETHPS